ncbi:cytoplasmic [NiFe]-hydrogenase, large subunit [Geotalea daltonii FRC-32]|uniref:Cytoplasmic [NiFe]-hydrogenase, large subunit n=1 Tax=Geotalea daltonii (strain DSM 22248 / JCM 15807 / FRC-32) TaxID=316067 RepID=B9M7G0_GEODF|nr:Ni/Fe hydrogenase subunit alpha [Geotalea daltonii]ACM20248.1 cytoplasmic [NiFe]-hydrogenase, large subunit [Geotalea daltonii FRC-32]
MSNIIEIKPLTRVEGHGVVRVFMDGSHVDRVELALVEPPRLFEVLLRGKHFREIPDIICRICSLCSTIHRVTALMAVEKAFGIIVSSETYLYRQLIVLGGHIQSHALHLFCLALPDHFNAAGFADLAKLAPDLLKLGLRIKAVGNDIQETIGGRLIHPINVKIGGMGQHIASNDLLRLQQSLKSILSDTIRTVELFSSFATPGPPLPPPVYLAVKDENAPPLFGDMLTTSTGIAVKGSDYRSALKESVNDHSNGKFSHFDDTNIAVGALSRLNMNIRLTEAAGKAFDQAKKKLVNGDMWQNNLAQAIELVFAVESAMEIIDSLLQTGHGHSATDGILSPKGEGTAITEAPRGVLIHSYSFNSRGYCVGADIITPTAINQAAIEQDLLFLARATEGAGEQEMKFKLEMLVRAYDPCISCAVHLISL